MGKNVISTQNAPAAIGPYSQGIEANGTVYVSGQLPINPQTGEFAGQDISSQAEQSLKNVQAVLAEAGLTLEHVVKATVFLKDIGDFAAMNEVYARYFTENCPARSAVQAAALPKDALVEIEVIAVR
ncbi:RidA family protein [Petralouisia muris]|uniref:RidA family protein n=1 Tax=Petralouisia muris TaxID=3032872 RepID=A0AC61S023_9FIRM|nr:RidA family protein [Petralouisia muris]TGY97348.1 RidA family protein [Petralouisia muris]